MPDAAVNLLARLISRLELGEAASKVLAVLVLSEHPLSQLELVKATGYSLSQVSSALAFLTGLGFVSFVRSGRKKLYYSEKNITDLVGEIARRMLEQDIKPLIRELEKMPEKRERIRLLLDDCNLAAEKLQKSFLPGIVTGKKLKIL
ncbi:MarR family transcriptional regulator [Thermofilum pendens]|uniref:Transcription regulator, MarR family n=1 Tax=Thermofilum pendens (strain DSM 2475 / Hrk 5) TaxID=368408 RepID=A1RZ18_THEPD|nr:MarR family transcriptional regulator [Thermofilum pendens]ABL78448.1 transcription regulator, MarR family [Thermofilum pendens Hrk 5]